jgi:hypothetical protein
MEKNDYKKKYENYTTVEEFLELIRVIYAVDDDAISAVEVSRIAEEKILEDEICYKKDIGNLTDLEAYNENPFIIMIKSDEDLLFKCMDNYKKINKRDPDKSYNGIDNWFQYEDNLQSVTICGRVTLQINLLKLAAVFWEFDLLSQNLSTFEDIKLLKSDYAQKVYTHCKIKVPLIQNRDLVISGLGAFNKKEKMLQVMFKEPTKQESEEFPKENSKTHTRMIINFGFYFCKYIDENTTELFTCFNSNPRIPAIPWIILNPLIKEFAYRFNDDFRKVCECSNIDTLYGDRIKKNKDFYNRVRNGLGWDEI